MNIQTILDKLNILDENKRISITNVTVALFVGIAAFRMAFGGSTLHLGTFNWVIQTIDIADTLPVFFGLLNYSHKRMINNQQSTDKESK